VLLDPFVALSLMEHVVRFNDSTRTRVEGILMGSHVKSVTEVRNFIPGLEDEFIRLTLRSAPRDRAIGWYTTEQTPEDKQVHEKIDSNVNAPVFMLIDVPTEANPNVEPGFRAFVKSAITFADGTTTVVHKQIPVEIRSNNLDTNIALDSVVGVMFPETAEKGDPARVASTADPEDGFVHLKKIKEVLSVAKKYVADVNAGKIAGDKAVGRELSALLTETEAKQRAAAASGITEDKTNDALMLLYLSRFVQTTVDKLEKKYQPPAPQAL
jgi:hypothetical protein